MSIFYHTAFGKLFLVLCIFTNANRFMVANMGINYMKIFINDIFELLALSASEVRYCEKHSIAISILIISIIAIHHAITVLADAL